MMKIKIISDLHLEFGNRKGILSEFYEGNYDILVIAGDLTISTKLEKELNIIDKMVNKPVLFIPGNHDYWYSTKYAVDNDILNKKYNNVVILNNDVIIIDDITFIGSTGWWDFNITPSLLRQMNDFIYNHDLITYNYGCDLGKESKSFIMNSLSENEKCVVITHNMPSYSLISDKYKGSPLNGFFANSWDTIIEKYNPDLWIFGHTHDSIDSYINNTRCICNPYGYFNHDTNPNFNNNLVITI